MNVLTLESVVVVEPPCINQRDVTLAVSGDDFFLTVPHLFGEVREAGSNLIHRNYVIAIKSHDLVH